MIAVVTPVNLLVDVIQEPIYLQSVHMGSDLEYDFSIMYRIVTTLHLN